MDDVTVTMRTATRETILHSLYEAAELEHNLMCTYLYAAFSLRSGAAEGLSPAQDAAVARWRRVILDVAIEEMAHLAAVWNITAALGGAPRFGRGNFPLDPGLLPAGVVVKLAPFSADVLQHFIHLERPAGSDEPEGQGFAPERIFVRGAPLAHLTPMGLDYDTVGAFYASISTELRALVEHLGEDVAFCGDPALQLSNAELSLDGVAPVRCLATALRAFDSIVAQGEGASDHSEDSHFAKFTAIRTEFSAIQTADPGFSPAHPAAHNPVLRRPPRPEGRVWIENPESARVVDLANAAYQLMLRLLAYAYAVPGPAPEKSFAVEAGIGLMRALALLGEAAARLPAGPSHPACNAGVSFTALRDTAPLPVGNAGRRFMIERLAELAVAAQGLAGPDGRVAQAARILAQLSAQAARRFTAVHAAPGAALSPAPAPAPLAPAPFAPPTPAQPGHAAEISATAGVERVEAPDVTLLFDANRCIHARFCVTGAPEVFLANVKGPWLHPEKVPVETLAAIAHACPSGAITYIRKDGHANEAPPPVNLAGIRENGPYALRGDLLIDGAAAGYRATLCRCGASRNKPYCDGSHNAAGFTATGEPPTGQTDMLAVRDGPLAVNPQLDGPLAVQGNLEIISGTGRVVARVQAARLCRCGGSASKPFCDGTHARIGFRST